MGLTLLEVRSEAQNKQYLIEWIGSVLGELPPQLTSTGNVNFADAIRDGKILFSLIFTLVRTTNSYSAISAAAPSSSSNPSDEYWDKCAEICKKAHLKSVSIEDVKKSIGDPESALVQAVITQLHHVCEDLKLGDEFWVFPNTESDTAVVESILDTSNLPAVNRGEVKKHNLCAVCGCNISGSKRPTNVKDGTYPIVVKLSCPWSEMICFKCYQKNRRRCIGEASGENGGAMRTEAKYTCGCGMKFASPQKKASHCRFCPFHKKAACPKPVAVPLKVIKVEPMGEGGDFN